MKSYHVVYVSIYVSGPKRCAFPAIDEISPLVCTDLFFLPFFRVLLHSALHTIVHVHRLSYPHVLCYAPSRIVRFIVFLVIMPWLSIFNFLVITRTPRLICTNLAYQCHAPDPSRGPT